MQLAIYEVNQLFIYQTIIFMRKSILFLLAAALLIGCEREDVKTTVLIDFEDVELSETGYFDGSNKSGELNEEGVYVSLIETGSIQLENRYTYDEEWDYGYWEGFAVSSLVDVETPGLENQYSTIAGSGAGGSKQFALVYDNAVMHLPPTLEGNQVPESIMITNSTYAYLDMKEGSAFSKKFTEGDWFKLIVTASLEGSEIGQKEFYLADFRDGKSLIVKDWTELSLISFDEVDKLIFSFDSSDKGSFGINTPTYACIDNLVVKTEICTSCKK